MVRKSFYNCKTAKIDNNFTNVSFNMLPSAFRCREERYPCTPWGRFPVPRICRSCPRAAP